MVEVFKTNVIDHLEASWLVKQIHRSCKNYKANFDLDDCDRILRVQSTGEPVRSAYIIALVKEYGFEAQILPDDYPLLEGIAWSKEIASV